MRDTLERAKLELAHWPDVRFDVENGGRHPKLKLMVGGTVRRVPFSKTGVDTRAQLNLICDMKKTLRAMGAERSER